MVENSFFGSRKQQAPRSFSRRLVVTWWCLLRALLLPDDRGAPGRVRGCDCGDRFARFRGHLALHWERHLPRIVFHMLELMPVPPWWATRCASWCRGRCPRHRHRHDRQALSSLSCVCACALRHGSLQVLSLPVLRMMRQLVMSKCC